MQLEYFLALIHLLVTIFWDGNFSSVQKIFDESGKLLDEAYTQRLDKFLQELV